MTNLPIKIHHHNLKNKQILGRIVMSFDYFLVEEEYTVGQLKTYIFGISDISGHFVIKIKIYRRKKYWSIYVEERYLDGRGNDGCTR